MDSVKITLFDIYRYTLPLNQPLNVHGCELTTREGLILHLKSDEGREGFGEIAPLPGLSKENIKEAADQLLSIKSVLSAQSVPEGMEKLDGKLSSWLEEFSPKPSVQFGVETAVLNLLANTKNKPLHQLISPASHNQIRVNGLLMGSKGHVKQEAKKLIEML